MSPAFYVKLGPIKLSKILSYISADIVGLDQNSEFNAFVGVDKIKSTDKTITFVYENYQNKIDIPKKANLIISKKEKDKFSKFDNLIIVDNVHEAVAKLSSIFFVLLGARFLRFNVILDLVREFCVVIGSFFVFGCFYVLGDFKSLMLFSEFVIDFIKS